MARSHNVRTNIVRLDLRDADQLKTILFAVGIILQRPRLEQIAFGIILRLRHPRREGRSRFRVNLGKVLRESLGCYVAAAVGAGDVLIAPLVKVQDRGALTKDASLRFHTKHIHCGREMVHVSIIKCRLLVLVWANESLAPSRLH